MKILKKIWNFLVFGSKKEPVVLEETAVEEKKETVPHCGTHTRFKKNCPNCLSAVGVV